MPKIEKAASWFSSHKTGSLDSSLTPEQINEALGFEADKGDPWKVKFEWHFYVDGVPCAIWDYKGVRWSTWGPRQALAKVFPGLVD